MFDCFGVVELRGAMLLLCTTIIIITSLTHDQKLGAFNPTNPLFTDILVNDENKLTF
jgi:hypothetical protein